MVDYWSAEDGVSSAVLRVRMRRRQPRNRRNISPEVSSSMRLMSAGFCGSAVRHRVSLRRPPKGASPPKRWLSKLRATQGLAMPLTIVRSALPT